MINRSLFKQSCKANGTMWAVITIAVCFMLACVMLIGGGSSITTTKNAVQDTIIDGELSSQIEKRSINYYLVSDKALAYFDESFVKATKEVSNSQEAADFTQKTFDELVALGNSIPDAFKGAAEATLKFVVKKSYAEALDNLLAYTDALAASKGYLQDSKEYLELKGIIFGVLNPMESENVYMFDKFYLDLGMEAPRYDFTSAIEAKPEERAMYRKDYAAKNSAIFLAGNMITKENIELVLAELSEYGVSFEKYCEFGYNSFSKINDLATMALVNFRSNFAYRVEHIKEGETIDGIELELTESLTESLLASLPDEVASGIEEIGKADLYGTLIGSIFFKMAGLLLPIIFIIMTANNLVAGQVDSGSMAYILASSTKRSTVMRTQIAYLVTAIFTMILGTTITSMICFSIVDVETELTLGKLALINLGAFIVLFAMSGICYLASCIFNRSKRSMAIGGGLTMFFLVATMLGLFGSQILPSVIRIDALNAFNKVSIISLFDVISILEGGTAYLWKFAILLGIGILTYLIGSIHFVKKDLPL